MPLIVLDGIDGCGKSTQIELLAKRLEALGRAHRRLREPGGTALGEAQRRILLDPATKACPEAELFGYLQARAQLCREVIAPALAAGEVVLLDRFYFSTIAYQAYGLGLPQPEVRAAIRLATGGIVPELALWFDVDPAEAARRRARARAGEDRIEARGLDYLRKVHDGFAEMASAGEMVRVDAGLPPADIAKVVWGAVIPLIG
ncbi:MAG: dTMP kinase [Planctomycetes bacterium]|nr:dTMP kinase [Planctomycetota bacterium]